MHSLSRRAALVVLLLSSSLSSYSAPTPGPPGSATDPKKPYALIIGTVFDQNQHPVYGVTVKIRRLSDKKARWEFVSNHTGEFAQRLPAGADDYLVWADLKDPQAAKNTEVKVHIENDERHDVNLHLKLEEKKSQDSKIKEKSEKKDAKPENK